MNGVGQAVGGGLALAANALQLSNYNKSADQLLAESQNSTGSVGGINYQQVHFDGDAEMGEVNKNIASGTLTGAAQGAAAGAVFGPIGAGIGAAVGGVGSFIGGLFGKSKAKKQIEEAKLRAGFTNNYNYSSAASTAQDLAYMQDHGDSSQQRIHAKNGKDAVVTASGYSPVKHNSYVNKGEWIWDGDSNLNYVDHGPNDTAKAYLRGKDTVFTTNYGIADMVPYAAATGQLPQLARYQKAIHALENMSGMNKNNKFRKGKVGTFSTSDLLLDDSLPTSYVEKHPLNLWSKFGPTDVNKGKQMLGVQQDPFDTLVDSMSSFKYNPQEGDNKFDGSGSGVIPWYTQLPNLLGGIASLGQIVDASRQNVKTSNSYVPNRYEDAIIKDAATRRYSSLPIERDIYRQKAYADYALRNSAGLSTGQRNLARVQNARGAYSAIADALEKLQQNNIGLGQAFDNTRMQLGENAARNRMGSAQFDLNYNGASHAARQAGKQQGLQNLLSYITNYGSDEVTRRLYNYQMGLYDRKLNNDKLAILNSIA